MEDNFIKDIGCVFITLILLLIAGVAAIFLLSSIFEPSRNNLNTFISISQGTKDTNLNIIMIQNARGIGDTLYNVNLRKEFIFEKKSTDSVIVLRDSVGHKFRYTDKSYKIRVIDIDSCTNPDFSTRQDFLNYLRDSVYGRDPYYKIL